VRFLINKKAPSMTSPKYYRRQSELCLQLALLYSDPQMTLLLVNLATELRAKADEADSASTAVPAYLMEPRAFSGKVESGFPSENAAMQKC
jgi:hypothetical protein